MAVRKEATKIMSDFPHPHPILQVLRKDPRYKLEAYQFVREALSFAQEVMGMGIAESVPSTEGQPERHLTGQQLCEASRLYALDQYGLMAKTVLESWGIKSTDDFGEIVYNLIEVDLMKKSEHDRREDFDGVFDFDKGLTQEFKFTTVDEIEF